MESCKFLKGSQLFLAIMLKSVHLVNGCCQIMYLLYTLTSYQTTVPRLLKISFIEINDFGIYPLSPTPSTHIHTHTILLLRQMFVYSLVYKKNKKIYGENKK